jgi:hypothetical protein
MPTADFSNEYSSSAGRSNFPRLRLQTNEYARIAIVSQPEVEYTHWLEAPNIVNMAPTYKKIKDRDGNEQWVVETRRVNNCICPGNYEVLKERGVDEHGCQACAYSRERPDIFRAPTARFAANVIRYGMRPGGGWSDIAQPYGIGTLIWVFGGKVMDKLLLIKTMGPGYEDLRMVDLLLACDDQNFQKPYSMGEFNALAPAAWMADDYRRKHTIEYLQQNSASKHDLSESIAKRVKEDWLADDLLRVIQRWDVVRAYESRQQGSPALGQGFGAESFGAGMQNLQQQFGNPQGQPRNTGDSMMPGGAPGGGAQGWSPGRNGQPSFGQAGGAGTNGFQPGPVQSVGVDMSLLNGQRPSAPPPQAPTGLEGIEQFAHSTQLPPSPSVGPIANMPAEASQRADALYAAAQAELAQNPIQSPVSDAYQQFLAQQQNQQQASPPLQNTAASQPTQQLPGPVPDGLAGLTEFMASQTHNPAPTLPPPPPVQTAQPTPPAGGHYSFEQLAQLGKQ